MAIQELLIKISSDVASTKATVEGIEKSVEVHEKRIKAVEDKYSSLGWNVAKTAVIALVSLLVAAAGWAF